MIEQPSGTPDSTLTARVAKQVLDAALEGRYRPSERLPSERDLAERLSVSRSTVTAAYATLEGRGLVRRIQGKGAYLCALPADEGTFSWSGKVSRFANALDEPILELLAQRCADQVRHPLSAGTPSLEIFSKEDYSESVGRVLKEAIPSALAVAPTEGQWSLRQALGTWIGVAAQNIMITAGAQEGIDLTARCLIEPGDFIVVDSPSYPGSIQSFLSAGAQLLPWNVGWSVPQLEGLLLRYRPKLIFTMPTFHNPTGRVMTLKTRLALLDLARRYRVPVVEDDVYGRTYFGDHPMPASLYSLDSGSQVIHLSTFSKMLAPGLRIGWLTAPTYMIKQLTLIKMRSNLFTGGLNQFALAEMITRGYLDRHLERLRLHHAMLCAAAVEAIQPSVARGLLTCRVPHGGLYLWCKLSAATNMDRLLARLEARGVSVAPGAAFEPERGREATPAIRLCFTAVPKESLVEGIQILNQTLEELAPASVPVPAESGCSRPYGIDTYQASAGVSG